MTPLQGLWFDGRSSRAQAVTVHLLPAPHGPALALHLAGEAAPALQLAHDRVAWPERFSLRRPPRQVVLDLHEHGSVQLDDTQAWYHAFAAAGARPSFAERMQTRWRVFAAVLLAACVLLWAFYRWGTPWAAAQLTRHVPPGWEQQLSAKVLADLDEGVLAPSKLPPERQAALRRRFGALAAQVTPALRRYGSYSPALALQFRAGLGANAFALPGGTIVMTDGLVEAAQQLSAPDDALVGVLAHEIGHVVHRHTTRMVVEQGVLNVGLGLALGDTSWMFANAGTLLTALAYRRSHEAEADCFAATLLHGAGVAPRPMADLLLAIDASAAREERRQGAGWASILASHPDTAERARKLAAGQAEGCS